MLTLPSMNRARPWSSRWPQESRAHPSDVRHLRITAWWLDVNTDEGESKAAVRITLVAGDGTRLRSVATRHETRLRLQFDRYDTDYPCPPEGELTLLVEALSVPEDRRSIYGEGELLRRWRTFYVAWFWETGTEDSTDLSVTCSGATLLPDDPCAEADLYDDGTFATESDRTVVAESRTRLDHAIADTLRIATRVASTAGTSWIGPEGSC